MPIAATAEPADATPVPASAVATLIEQAVAATLTPDFIETQINKRVEKTITDIIDSAVSRYGAVGKQIEEAVTAALKVNQLNLPRYGEMVTAVLEREVKERAGVLIEGRLVEDMRKLLNIAPQEIKLSEIAEDMIKTGDFDGKYGPVITVIVEESSYGTRWIYLDGDEHYRDSHKHLCEASLVLREDGSIVSAAVDGKSLSDITAVGHTWGIRAKVLAWYAAGTKIVIDKDAVITSVGDY